jgi:hypothetical protein
MWIYLSGIDMDTSNGMFHYDCMTKALQMNLKTDGVLLMSDDVLIKPWNMKRKLDVDKIWIVDYCTAETIPCRLMVPSSQPNWIWWAGGIEALNKSFTHMRSGENEPRSQKIFNEFIRLYELNTQTNFKRNKVYAVNQGGDVFYLPKRHFASFIELGELFRRNGVFLELAVPIILFGLDEKKDFEIIKYGYNFYGHFNYKQYDDVLYFFHPAKLSVVEKDAEQRQLFCKKFVVDKYTEA